MTERSHELPDSHGVSWWGIAIGLLWFVSCAATGAYLLLRTLTTKSDLSGLFLPFYMIAWVVIFFSGQSAVFKIAAKIGVPLGRVPLDATRQPSPHSTTPSSVSILGGSSAKSAATPVWRLIAGGPASLVMSSTFLAIAALVIYGVWRIPNLPLLPTTNDFEGISFPLRKLSATMLVYFMQFGFIAFEAGSVRKNYRRQSAIKNLIVFAVSFVSYICVGSHIQRYLLVDKSGLSSLLDIAFNAGFASTVALIVANVITERGTLLVNSSCAFAASLVYACLAGIAFKGDSFRQDGTS